MVNTKFLPSPILLIYIFRPERVEGEWWHGATRHGPHWPGSRPGPDRQVCGSYQGGATGADRPLGQCQ